MAVVMTKRLDELPEELVSNISLRLHADDTAALRLTCRAIEHKTFHEFATEYFHSKCFMFTTDSLKVLTGIANSEKLRGFLHHIHFITAYFSATAFGCPNGCNCAWQPSVKQKEAYRGYIDDQNFLSDTGKDKEILREAFSKLPNLSSLYLNDSPHAILPEVDYRGRNKIPRVTGRPPSFAPEAGKDGEYSRFLHHAWKIIMESVAQSKISTITGFGTQFNRARNGLSISPDLALSDSTLSDLTTAFKGLQKLLLRVQSAPEKDSIASRSATKAQYKKTLKKFASILPPLEILDLSFDNISATENLFQSVSESLDFSKMTKLCLDGIFANAAPLATAIYKLELIKDLRFVFINLTKGNWITVLKVVQKHTEHLTHLHLMYLLQAGRKVYFLKQREDDDMADPFFDDEWEDDPDDFPEGDSESEFVSDDDMPPLEPADGAAEGESTGAVDGYAQNINETNEEVEEDDNGGENDDDEYMENDNEHDEDEDDDEEEEDSIIGEDGDVGLANGAAPSAQLTPVPQNTLPANATTPPPVNSHSEANHVSPDDPGSGERGYFVCVQGDEIVKQLPIFIEEYNLGDNVKDEAAFMAPPPGMHGNLNNFFNMMMNAPVLPVPAGPPPLGFGDGHSAHGAHGANVTAQAHGGAGGAEIAHSSAGATDPGT